jgi:hypothetical protein
MKTNISKIHLDILDQNRKAWLEKISPLLSDFVLGGGTALALQIQGRQSYDFDFFSYSPLKKNLLEKISQNSNTSIIPLIDTDDELTFLTASDIKTTFIYYPFKKGFEQVEESNGLKFFSISAISAQKAYAVGRRGVYRDYFDIFTILKQKLLTLGEIIQNANLIYGDLFNEKLFLSQLVYFDDLTEFEITPINLHAKIIDKEEVKGFLENSTKVYLNKGSNA